MYSWKIVDYVNNRYNGISYYIKKAKIQEKTFRIIDIRLQKKTQPPLQLICVWTMFVTEQYDVYKYKKMDPVIFEIFTDYLQFLSNKYTQEYSMDSLWVIPNIIIDNVDEFYKHWDKYVTTVSDNCILARL